MGNQVHVQVADFVAAGCTLDTEYEHFEADPEQGWPAATFAQTLIEFPCGREYWMQGAIDEGTLWCDFNHGGDNRAVLELLLKSHQIPWIEG